MPRHRVSPSVSLMTGSCGVTSTPRPLGSISAASRILDRLLSWATTVVSVAGELVSDFICQTATLSASSPGLTGRPSIPEALVLEPRGRGVLDAPHARGMTAVGDANLRSRGTKCPSCWKRTALEIRRGRRECRMRVAPEAACAAKSTGVSNQGYTATAGGFKRSSQHQLFSLMTATRQVLPLGFSSSVSFSVGH